MPTDRNATDSPPPPLGLSSEPPGGGRITGAQFEKWSALYGKQHRQIRRWIAKGEKEKDPCPLDDPARMPQWWTRHMTWSVPEKITAAAANAQAAATAAQLPPSPATGTAPDPGGSSPAPETTPVTPMNLSEFDLGEGEAIRKQRSLVSAIYTKLERAYLGGTGDADHLQAQFLKAQESLRKLEVTEREVQKQLRMLIPRHAIERDLATCAEMLRQMRESMARRVLELCPQLPMEYRKAVADAVLAVRSQEDRVLSNLDSLNADDSSRRAA